MTGLGAAWVRVNMSDHEQFAQYAYDKRAGGVIRSFSRVNRYFALSLTKSERFARKADERIPNPAYS